MCRIVGPDATAGHAFIKDDRLSAAAGLARRRETTNERDGWPCCNWLDLALECHDMTGQTGAASRAFILDHRFNAAAGLDIIGTVVPSRRETRC